LYMDRATNCLGPEKEKKNQTDLSKIARKERRGRHPNQLLPTQRSNLIYARKEKRRGEREEWGGFHRGPKGEEETGATA